MFSGSLVAIVTPMRADGSLDFAGVVAAASISHRKRHERHRRRRHDRASLPRLRMRSLPSSPSAPARSSGRIPVIAGGGGSSTAATVERVQRLSQLPVDALSRDDAGLQPPDAGGPVPALCRDRRKRRACRSLPTTCRRAPRWICLPATVARLAQLSAHHRHQRGGRSDRARAGAARTPAVRSFVVLSGDDATAREAMLAGARGVISVTANVAPRAMARACRGGAGRREPGQRRGSSMRRLRRCTATCSSRRIPSRPSGCWRAWGSWTRASVCRSPSLQRRIMRRVERERPRRRAVCFRWSDS